MALDPHSMGLIVGTVGAGLLMALAGLEKRALEWKQRRRICPSCGRDLRSSCRCL
jgi:hypothetical protein